MPKHAEAAALLAFLPGMVGHAPSFLAQLAKLPRYAAVGSGVRSRARRGPARRSLPRPCTIFRRAPGLAVQRAEVRVIAASNRGLRELAKKGSLCEDLHYLPSVLTLQLPPLRECGANVLLLAAHLLRQFGRPS